MQLEALSSNGSNHQTTTATPRLGRTFVPPRLKTTLPFANPMSHAPRNGLAAVFHEAETLLEEGGFTTGLKALREERQRAATTAITIAIVGEFKTGKSTFANAAFLGRRLLYTDRMEATCVPTEITHGELPRLQVFPILRRTETFAVDENVEAAAGEVRCGEEAAFTIDHPDAEEIRGETTADTPGERAFKARKIARVRLEVPLEALRNLVLIDTAGIDSTNTAVVETTYGVLPRCDAAILVLRRAQLTDVEIRFLQSHFFESGATRLLVVLNQFQDQLPLADQGRAKVMEAVRAQLRSIGRESVSVGIVDAHEWLECLGAGVPVPEETAAFQRQLERFLRLEVTLAREEKSIALLLRELRSALLEAQAEVVSRQQSQVEVERLLQQLQRRERELRPKLELAGGLYLDELRAGLRDFKARVRGNLGKAANRFIEQLRNSGELARTQALIRDADHLLQPEFEAVMSEAVRELRQVTRSATGKYEKAARTLLADLELPVFSVSARDQSLFSNLPAPVVTLVDYYLVALISPLPSVADILLRMFADRFPELRKLLPVGLVQNTLVRHFETGLRDQLSKALREIDERLEAAAAGLQAEVRENASTQLAAEVAPLQNALIRAREGSDPERRALLDRLIGGLQRVHGELSKHLPR